MTTQTDSITTDALRLAEGKQLRAIVLVENEAIDGLGAEHGWAVLIETPAGRLLFDTGQTDLVARNADALGVSLEGLDVVALSHGHYDHAGGLPAVLKRSPEARVAAHPDAFCPKWAKEPGGGYRANGVVMTRAATEEACGGVLETRTWTEVLPGVWCTGRIPRENGPETPSERFHIGPPDNRRRDLFPDDQALVAEVGGAIVVFLGCTHAGVSNTLQHVRKHFNGRPVRAVHGGMHLGDAGPERLTLAVQALKSAAPERMGPAHCTGANATAALREIFGERVVPCPAGTVLTWAVREGDGEAAPA